jgi:hypothetical protein
MQRKKRETWEDDYWNTSMYQPRNSFVVNRVASVLFSVSDYFILVIGLLYEVELLSLDASRNPVPARLQNLNRLPRYLNSHARNLFTPGNMTVTKINANRIKMTLCYTKL